MTPSRSGYAARTNGLDALALTKLDVLDGLEQIEVCTAYKVRRPDHHRSSRRPADPCGVRARLRDAPGLELHRRAAFGGTKTCPMPRAPTFGGSKK